MTSEPDICEPLVKKERLDEDLEMVNYEMPLQIDVPVAADAEIDPLMPVESNHEPAAIVQPSSALDFVQPIKSEPEIKKEWSGKTDEIQSIFPKSDSMMSDFEISSSKVPESFVFENSELLAGSDDVDFTPELKPEIFAAEAPDVEEITIEPKEEFISGEVSGSVDCDSQLMPETCDAPVGADGPEIQPVNESPQALEKQHLSFITTQLMKPPELKRLEQRRLPDPAVSEVRKAMHHFTEPLSHASRNVTHFTNASQGQGRDTSNSANILSPVPIDRPANCIANEIPRVRASEDPETSAKVLNDLQLLVQNQSKWQPTCMAASAAAIQVVPSSHQDPPKESSPILEPVSVSRLLKNPFSGSTWTHEEKNAIVIQSRPKPNIESLLGASAERFYNEIPWLCGSSSLKRFFCWPCLLIFYHSFNTGLWSVPATFALGHEFTHSWKAHEASHAHQAAEMALKIWLQSVNGPPPPNSNKKQRVKNPVIVEKVRKNRKLISLLVQSICYLKKVRGDAQIEDYAECFCYIVPSNVELQEALTGFQGDSSTESSADFVFNYALLVEDAVKKFLKSKISDELKRANFVSLFLEDFSSIVDKSTVAVIAHFVDQAGDIQQRVIELNEIGYDRSAGTVFTLFQNVVSKHGLRLKVAGFTYSATLVNPYEIAAFNVRIERLCPVAKFFHYQGHNLMGMLFGALSHLNKKCWNFFQTITELQEFFKKHLQGTFLHFEQFNSRSKFPKPKHDFDHGFITTLKQCYCSVLETFGAILGCPEEWETGISSQAPIFMSFLQDATTRFMISLISQLNFAIVDVAGALQGKIDTSEWKLRIRRAIANLINVKNFGFEDIYLTSLSPILVKENHAQSSEAPVHIVAMFSEIIDTAIRFLHLRFDSPDFGYVDLETVATRYYTRLNLKSDEIEKFRFQIQLLAKEPVLKDKTLAEALKYFYDCNLAIAVPEYATFLDFAMTIPSSRSSIHCPAVERILHYQRNPSYKPISEDLIWMEKELLTDISRHKKLSEAVIDILVIDRGAKEFSYDKFCDLISN